MGGGGVFTFSHCKWEMSTLKVKTKRQLFTYLIYIALQFQTHAYNQTDTITVAVYACVSLSFFCDLTNRLPPSSHHRSLNRPNPKLSSIVSLRYLAYSFPISGLKFPQTRVLWQASRFGQGSRYEKKTQESKQPMVRAGNMYT